MNARYVVAPMVDASELAWRLLCRRHGAQLCYSPMLHSNVFKKDPKYRKDALATCPEDRPLIVQFCGNDPDTLLAAAQLAEPYCDAIDINLGCPQSIAKRGHYGAFLQDDWALLDKIVKTLSNGLKVPVTCKVRIFEDLNRTLEYALMLQNAGCKLLTVHGRTREQKGPLTGLANWDYVKAVREAVSIPVFANGNIRHLNDVHRCLDYTGVNGVMSAEGNLTNPAIFEGASPTVWDMSLEYLSVVEKYPCPMSYIRGHLFKICHMLLSMESNSECREALATAQNVETFVDVIQKLKAKYLPYHRGEDVYSSTVEKCGKIENGDVPENCQESTISDENDYNLSLPPWICQPYVRMSPSDHIKKMQAKQNEALNKPEELKRHYEDSEGNVITRKKMKKLRRIERRPPKEIQPPRPTEICEKCPNPAGTKCLNKLCKVCCRNKCFYENLDCPGHRILFKTRRDLKAKHEDANTKTTELPHIMTENTIETDS